MDRFTKRRRRRHRLLLLALFLLLASMCLLNFTLFHLTTTERIEQTAFEFGCIDAETSITLSPIVATRLQIRWRVGAIVLDIAIMFFVVLLLRTSQPFRPRKPKYAAGFCEACGYNLRGNRSGVCPECGTPIPPRFRRL